MHAFVGVQISQRVADGFVIIIIMSSCYSVCDCTFLVAVSVSISQLTSHPLLLRLTDPLPAGIGTPLHVTCLSSPSVVFTVAEQQHVGSSVFATETIANPLTPVTAISCDGADSLSPASVVGLESYSQTFPEEALLFGGGGGSGDDSNEEALDTIQVASRVRALLTMNNISQRRFAREVVPLGIGTLNELLSKPRPWSTLTRRTRGLYKLLNNWASDPTNASNMASPTTIKRGIFRFRFAMSPSLSTFL